ncbi:MAG: OB-fold domain-containing protein [Dehalococcoidia bacterium]|nr:OB-fold domain-containing protein [Dehalococcoidia bacterium]
MAEAPRPFPLPDRDTAPFWEAQNKHELKFQKCTACATVRYLVGPLCPECRSFDFAWITSSGRGKIYSYTVVRHQTHPAFPVPYTVALVEMEEGPRVIAQLRVPEDAGFDIGAPVRVEWEDHPKQSLPVFVLDA